MSIHVTADIAFRVRPATAADGALTRRAEVDGSVRADGSVISVRFSRTPSFTGGSRTLARPWADLLHRNGVVMQLSGPAGLVAEVGAVDAPWWQRLLTGSRHVRLGSARALVGSVGGPRLFDAVLPPELPSSARRRLRGPAPRVRA